MIRLITIFTLLSIIILSCSGGDITVTIEGMNTIKLQQPEMKGGKPLMDALKNRKSSRNFSPVKLTDRLLSNLLWAAFGINRPDKGLRTAPSAVNWQETDIYVSMEDGIYLYQPIDHSLRPVAKGDFRGTTGSLLQSFVKTAPINLLYIADYSKIGASGILVSDEDRTMFTSSHSGFIAQNVYLFCASEGLATVVRGLVNREKLRKILSLKESQKIILAQSVGYPSDGKTALPLDLSGIQDGPYTGKYTLEKVTYEVKVTIKKNKIERIEILNAFIDKKYEKASKQISDRIIKSRSLDVDAVTGATKTSTGIKNAVRNSIMKADKSGRK